jgi:hypothetical protein
MPSLAACIGADIAVLTRDMATGDTKQRPHVYLPRPAEGTGAVVQMPPRWRLLAGRLGQQSRASGSGDIPVAPLRVVMFDGRYDAASGRHRGHYTAILPEQQCHPSGTGGMVKIAATGVRRLESAPLSRMTRSRAVRRHRGKRWCVRYSDKGYGDVPGLHMSIDFARLAGGEGRGDQSLKEREAGRPRAGCTTGSTSLFRNTITTS